MRTPLRRGLAVAIGAGVVVAGITLATERGPDEGHSITFAVQSPQGRVVALGTWTSDPAPGTLAVARTRGTQVVRPLERRRAGDGRTTVVGLRPDEDAVLWVAGCRELPLVASTPDAPLRLEHGPRVALRVRVDAGLPDGDWWIGFRPRWRGPGDAPDALLRHRFLPAARERWIPSDEGLGDAVARFQAGRERTDVAFAWPGRYRAEWTLVRVTDRGGFTETSTFDVHGSTWTFEVADTSEAQALELTVARRDLEAAGLPPR
jgi:hypothetical protein